MGLAGVAGPARLGRNGGVGFFRFSHSPSLASTASSCLSYSCGFSLVFRIGTKYRWWFTSVQSPDKTHQVYRRCYPPAMRVQRLHVEPAVRPRHVLRPCPQYESDRSFPRIIIVIHFASHLFFGAGTSNLHPCDLERSQYVLLNVFFIRLSGLVLYDPAQDAVAEVRICVLRARVKVQGLIQHKPDYVITNDRWFRSGMCRHTPLNEYGIVADAAVPSTRMMQQLAHGDFVSLWIENLTTWRVQVVQNVERALIQFQKSVLD